jgi:hypothetical protein
MTVQLATVLFLDTGDTHKAPHLPFPRHVTREHRELVLNSCTCSRNDRWSSKRETKASLWPNSSTPSPPNHTQQFDQLTPNRLHAEICDGTLTTVGHMPAFFASLYTNFTPSL